MPQTISNDVTLARMMGLLYTEVFQRKPRNDNKPFNRGTHGLREQAISDAFKSRLVTGTNVYIWGPGGVSDETDGTPSSARWGFSGTWG